VFVVGTGRCGTMTFTRAAEHLTNFTAGHETRARQVGDERFRYDADHVEADNRLSWFLGPLAQRFDRKTTLYVHLTRDRSEVIDSYLRRFDNDFRASIVRAFGHGILTRVRDWSPTEKREVCAMYVDSVTSNLEHFLRGQCSISMQLEELPTQFENFVDLIGGQGDLNAMLSELGVRHNASPQPG